MEICGLISKIKFEKYSQQVYLRNHPCKLGLTGRELQCPRIKQTGYFFLFCFVLFCFFGVKNIHEPSHDENGAQPIRCSGAGAESSSLNTPSTVKGSCGYNGSGSSAVPNSTHRNCIIRQIAPLPSKEYSIS